MNHEPRTSPLLPRSMKVYGSTALIALVAFTGLGNLIHESAPQAVEYTRVQESPNLPGGKAMMKDINYLNVHSGYGETCAAELWMVPAEYTTVADFLNDHPDAKPDRKRIVEPSERDACSANATLGFSGLSRYYSSVSASTDTKGPKA